MSEFHLRDTTSISPRVKQKPKLPGPFFYSPSDDGTDENLLILLHGLGDTHLPFSKLGKSLKLPQTAILAIRAPEQVPFLYEDAYQWYTTFDDLGELLEQPNPTPALQYLTPIIEHLTTHCAWPLDHIHFFGFAQGGSVTAEFVLESWKAQLQAKDKPERSFGSIVCISGPLLSYPTLSTPCPTPVLIAHRRRPAETALPPNAIAAYKKGFQPVTESTMDAKQAGMPASKDEWEPIMRFWSERLFRRQVEGLYEVMTGATSG